MHAKIYSHADTIGTFQAQHFVKFSVNVTNNQIKL